MTDYIYFTAEVDDMFGNLDLPEKSEDELLDLLEDTYDIPKDCILELEVR